LCFFFDFLYRFLVDNTIAMKKLRKNRHARSYDASLVVDDGGSEIFCKIVMMEIKVGSFEEEFSMKKSNGRLGTRSLIPEGDVEIMAGNEKAVKWPL
jgi:hypothetical protein